MRKGRLLTIVLSALTLAACPLPFQFTPEDGSGGTASNDPANPSVTASPQLLIREQTTGSTLDATPAAITARRNIDIRFESETPGASIFYTTDGSRPVPGQGTTVSYDADAPLQYSSDGAGATLKAIAIGPSMYPSPITERVVTVDYPNAAAPVYDPAPGVYQSDQTVTLSSSTSGATIYFTTAPGTGGAPTPQPGQPGTLEYTGPFTVAGAGTSTSIAAVARGPERKDSTIATAVYSIGFTGNAEAPVFSLLDGFQPDGAELTLSTDSQTGNIYYTFTTDGTEPPDPVPGTGGTFEYTGPQELRHGGAPDFRQKYRFKAMASGGTLQPSGVVSVVYDVIPEIRITRTDDAYPQWGVPRTLREATMALQDPSGWWNQSPPVWADNAEIVMITLDQTLNAGNPYTITLLGSSFGGLRVDRSVVIAGRSGDPDHVTISAGNDEIRPFSIGNPENANLFVQFQDVTIADGYVLGGNGSSGSPGGSGGGGGAGAGGAVYVDHGATAVFERTILRNNTAQGGAGGNGNTAGQSFFVTGANGGRGRGFGDGFGSQATGGHAGVDGGGGGPGGNGGWLGGGAAGGSDDVDPGVGGNGGFGGGGGGGGATLATFNPGAPGGSGGQFGGGGGTGVLTVGTPSGGAGGGGGAGLGGAIFVRNGLVIVRESQFTGNLAQGGARGATPVAYQLREAGPGQGQGGAIFVHSQGQYQDGGGNSFNNNEARNGSGSANGVTAVYEM